MFEWIASPEAWISLVVLTALEIVLGIDNIIFLSILVGRLPAVQRNRARIQGLALAMITRIALLLSLAWMMRLTEPMFTIMPEFAATLQDVHLRDALAVSGRDLILVFGGLFLLWKSADEIFDSLEGDEHTSEVHAPSRYWMVLAQIAIIDIVFSLDSVITAVGMAQHVPVMVIAIIIAVGVMMMAAKTIGDFVEAHPSIKMLALSFLILVGVVLIAEGVGQHIPKGYIYFAMAFSVAVEMLNIQVRKRRAAALDPVHLRGEPHAAADEGVN
ncbi:TerC family protein [Lamprocystis purpurea]|jgi:predicted tellurium resistance membrane protein TerC|uniref:TerC family protein n=1 Tax=Lamprocystis purpurea TaxID=61598 RepID=UPI00037B17A2|nr:TerC family protein [Lamprocystis purpurea]